MLEAGQQFAHFKIIRKLGEGGMGQVFLAEDQKLSRQVSLKTLAEDCFDEAEHRERFRREAKTAAQISHPNVMGIYDIGTVEDPATGQEVSYIVMEYVRGQPLATYLKDHKPGLAKVLRLAEKIAAGLSAAHQMRIVHRDIKTENILVDDDGKPTILDFGLAKPVDMAKFEGADDSADTISQQLTRAGKILGTVSYMSPEQVRGEPVDHRSDIFSFGTLLYRVCTGELPFTGQTQVSAMAKILETPHKSPRLKNKNIPPELERIIDKCLQKGPDDRYQDTRDLVVDLRNLRRQLDSGVTGAISVITGRTAILEKPRGFRMSWKHGAFLILAAVAVAAMMKAVGYFSGPDYPSATFVGTNSLAILGFENKTGDSDLDWLQTGLPEIMLTDLSQNQQIPIISQQRILDCLPVEKKSAYTREDCVTAARTLGASRLLSGSFFKLGEKIRIDARLEDIASGRIILGEKVIGDEPFVLVDSLTSKIAASLDLGEMQNVTAFVSSPEAFKQYHLGMELFWSGSYDEAVEKFNEALAIDSTFALPYMRIAMANAFRGRQSEAVTYFQLAKQYEDRLPVRERNLLDAYADTWETRNFDAAFTKMKSLLRNYPEDGEIRTIYALFVDVFQRDSAVAFAHLDTVLITYPTYPFAIDCLAALYEQHGNYDRALELAEKFQTVSPDALEPKQRLARLYDRLGRRDEAMALAEELLKRFPDDPAPLYRLISLSIRKRDFASARQYVEMLRQQKPDDAYNLRDCYYHLANLAVWKGNFSQSMDNRFAALEQATATGDSAAVSGVLNQVATYYRRFDMADSAFVYAMKSYEWAAPIERLDRVVSLILIDSSYAAIARPMFRQTLDDFKAHVPREFWSIADRIEPLFEANARGDTAALIEAYRALIEERGELQSLGNVLELGVNLVLFGEHAEGRNTLERFLSGRHEATSGWYYPYILYVTGIANEALGNKEDAVENYREMLGYWGNPDMELNEIRDARERLARLTS